MSTHFQKPVIILGAGIAGLAFAQALQTHSDIPFIIMERDNGFKQRSQGYRVSLGGKAVNDTRAVMSPELFDRLCGSCPEPPTDENGQRKMGSWLNAVTGEELKNPWTLKAPQVPKGTIVSLSADRTVLRDVLVRGIEHKIQYSKEFVNYDIAEDGNSVIVHFQDGTSTEGSLLVAADGARSRARRQLLGDVEAAQLLDTELRIVYGRTLLTKELEAQLNEKVLVSGTSILKDDEGAAYPTGLVLEALRFKKNQYREELPHDYMFWALCARQPRFAGTEFQHMSHEQAAALSKEITANWHPSIRPLFEMQSNESATAIRIGTVKPDLPYMGNKSKGRVTLIGDAAHAMSPSAGKGACNAIKDGEVLARMLRQQGLTMESVIEGYNKEMREYVAESLSQGEKNGQMMFKMPSYTEMKTLKV